MAIRWMSIHLPQPHETNHLERSPSSQRDPRLRFLSTGVPLVGPLDSAKEEPGPGKDCRFVQVQRLKSAKEEGLAYWLVGEEGKAPVLCVHHVCPFTPTTEGGVPPEFITWHNAIFSGIKEPRWAFGPSTVALYLGFDGTHCSLIQRTWE